MPDWDNVIRFLRRVRGLTPDQIKRLTDKQLAEELAEGRPVASPAEIAAANAAGANKGMARAVALFDRVAKKWGLSPAALAGRPIDMIVEACRMEEDGRRTTVDGVRKILPAYRAHHRLPAAG